MLKRGEWTRRSAPSRICWRWIRRRGWFGGVRQPGHGSGRMITTGGSTVSAGRACPNDHLRPRSCPSLATHPTENARSIEEAAEEGLNAPDNGSHGLDFRWTSDALTAAIADPRAQLPIRTALT